MLAKKRLYIIWLTGFIILSVGLLDSSFITAHAYKSLNNVSVGSQGPSVSITATAVSQPSSSPTPNPTPDPSPTPIGTSQLIKDNLDEVLVAILTVIGTLFVVYFQKIIGKLNSFFDWVWKRFKVERAIETRYRKNLARELRSIQILQMTEAKNLETIYIPLRLGKWMPPEMKEGTESINQKTLSMIEGFEQFQRITIVGGPGSGKTTITSHATAAIADNISKILGKNYFPVYVQLRRLKEFLDSEKHKDKTLRDLVSDILDQHGFSDSRKFLDRKIAEGSCLIVLDGFDELADETGALQLRLSQKIADFVGGLQDGNRVVLTSRAAGYEPAWFSGFQVLEMTELTLPQIIQFVNGWFAKDPERGKALQRILEQSERLQLLVTTPLMLAIVCFVYQTKRLEEHFLPTRRVDLYERCARTLIIDWDKSRRIDRKPNFSLKQVDTILSYIAYDALLAEKIDFSSKSLLTLIRTHLPNIERMRNEDEDFLNEVMEHTGLFREKAHDTFGFIHLTFYEYFAAQVIASKVLQGSEKKDLRSELGDILRNITNPRWFEPISLASGILRGRSELVNVLYEEYKARPTVELQLLLAGCLRDANLDEEDLGSDFLLIQDMILSEVVKIAYTAESL
ncbi:MAG TPA: NACHT domain-containing protein [Anaerolineales bacterium]|uniref:NACHT domain-containing protein n=1 Tax=Candidatus Brocadia sp. AMX2 TaxID=2293635 RepID=UPI001830EBE1|nr:NACHT domain-containing protein [Candidatus Brocadia sp. AMX2]MBC6934152.1 NACHT domain-containing protein [Candidatus Brocadia sp.]MBL1170843.1 NACHT domain-containing protein [Chloroflexota bacterium]WKZ55542.1 MAG: NACHT domain-containing protein [Anaerolineales bacterium]MDL1937380.1 NACHT domain-containing protein [Candidatus Brocadia sp. AMX2]NOG74291.1 NACHT domain-containing protein [Chloroflexota bacterium]